MERSPAIYNIIPPRFRFKVEDLLLTLKNASKSVGRFRFGFWFAIRLNLSYLLQVTLGLLWTPISRLRQIKVANKEVFGLALLPRV